MINYPFIHIDGIIPPTEVWLSGGIYCAKGTTIDTESNYGTSGSSLISIIPLIGGNTDDTKYVIRKNQTPQQITEFIQANIDNTGRKLFTTLVDMDSGMFGSESTSANDWSLITSETSQSKQFTRFAVCAGVSDGVVAMLTYPDELSDYNMYKDRGRM